MREVDTEEKLLPNQVSLFQKVSVKLFFNWHNSSGMEKKNIYLTQVSVSQLWRIQTVTGFMLQWEGSGVTEQHALAWAFKRNCWEVFVGERS